ncbi:MAG: hypothetical protein ACTHMU_16365 [Thermomicrobiales bacterium]
MSAPRPRAGTSRTYAFQIKVVGMKDLRHLLRTLDEGLPAELRDTNKQVVEQVLVPPVRAATAAHRPGTGYNARTGRSHLHWADAVASVRAVSSQTSSAILYGSTARSKAWMVGYEFGSIGQRITVDSRHPHGRHSTRQFPPASPRLGKGSEGYFFYPTIRRQVPAVIDAYYQALDRFIGRTVNANPPRQEGV